MGLLDKLFKTKKGREAQPIAATYFKTLTAYQPVFRSWNGMLYESLLVRAAIDARARHIAKLKVEILGAAKPRLQTALRKRPNPYQTWYQFLYRVSTILDMQNNCFIVPIINVENEISGYWACIPSSCEVLEDKNGKEWLRYKFSNGAVGAVEYSRCGIMTKHQYKDDFFGESNRALNPTMELLMLQEEGVKAAIKNSQTVRFAAKRRNWKDPIDLKEEQAAFTNDNIREDLPFYLFPSDYDDIQQIKADPFTLGVEQTKQIQKNVFDYFGVNEEIMQNKAVGDQLDGFFDGSIEPFAIQFSEVMTLMTFTDVEIGFGSRIMATANRLQYMKTSDKINFVAQLGDRGFITINEARELLNYPEIEGGDRLPIRGEYKFVGEDEDPGEGGEENGDQEQS